MSDQQPAFPPPTISDVRHGWGLSVEELHQLLQAEPTTWEYCEPGPIGEEDYVVIYRHVGHNYHQCWVFDQDGVMWRVQVLIPTTESWLVDAFLIGSHISDGQYFYKQETVSNPAAAPVLSIEEVEGGVILSIIYREVFGDEYRQACNLELVPPTISIARHGWGLSVADLNALLLTDPNWIACEPATTEGEEYVVMYRNREYNFCQCWDFNPDGKMVRVRLLILPIDQWLVGAFLTGARAVGDSYFYLKEKLAHPGAEGLDVYMQEHEKMTVLRVKFHVLNDTQAA